MTPVHRPLLALGAALAFGLASARMLRAQDSTRAASDTARVSYHTREILFITAGRDQGLGVGDTISILSTVGSEVARAVVVSVARATASARLLDGAGAVENGMRVQFTPRPIVLAAAPVADSTPAAPDTAAQAPDTTPPVPRRIQRLRAGMSLEQYGSSSGASASLSSGTTVAAVDLDAPLGAGASFIVRGNGRWRTGQARSLTGTDQFTALLYQAEVRIGSSESRANASIGRFIARDVMALGYLDGLRLEVRAARSNYIGLVGGLVPTLQSLAPSSATKRVGAYWRTGGGFDAFQASIAAAADLANGARQRTEIAAQTFARVSNATSLSLYGDLDLPAGAQTKAQLTTLFATLRSDLPLGFRGSIGVESHEPIPIWNAPVQPDTTIPPPGRLTGATLGLGHKALGFQVDVTAGALKRVGDATSTLRGSLFASRGGLFLTALVQHGDLMDYANFGLRFLVPGRVLPFTLALGGAAAMSKIPSGSAVWRYSFRPEISRSLGSGWYASMGGDLARYAGQGSTWLHAGVSYRLR